MAEREVLTPAELAAMVEPRTFPTLETALRVPWSLARAAYRHYRDDQTLERIAERGGFGLSEIACLLGCNTWGRPCRRRCMEAMVERIYAEHEHQRRRLLVALTTAERERERLRTFVRLLPVNMLPEATWREAQRLLAATAPAGDAGQTEEEIRR